LANLDRNPWLAGIFTVLAVGLGHIYSGQAKKGIFLYFIGQGVLLAAFLPLIYFSPTTINILIVFFVSFAFIIYCVVNAVKLSKRHKYGYKLKRYNKWYVYLGSWILATVIIQPCLSIIIKANIIQAYKIPAGSLKPTLLIGDHILARKAYAVKQGIKRGDMVIFPYPDDPSKDYIKRIVALGGEALEIMDKKVLINGEILNEPYVIYTDQKILQNKFGHRDNLGPLTVPDDSVFVLGDNRDESNDSRFWGFLKRATIKGKAYSIYWSWDRESFRVRWNRIGKRIE
jgi:signal peptidase I